MALCLLVNIVIQFSQILLALSIVGLLLVNVIKCWLERQERCKTEGRYYMYFCQCILNGIE